MENFNVQDMAGKIMDSMQKEYKELKTLNVMILGKTGVGKSTLINNMFNQKVVETGIGKPVTQSIRKKEIQGVPLAIYDTPGLELGGEHSARKLLEEVKCEIDKGIESGDVNKAIHCIWYCVSTPTHRFEQSEIEFLKNFYNDKKYDVPIIIVLTQSYAKTDAKQLVKEIEKENLPVVNIVPVLAEDYTIDDYVIKAYGLDVLSEVVNNAIPETVKKTFVSVQKVNLELKADRAQKVVAASAVAAAATGAIPIPFSDAAVLIPEQLAMLGGITAIYGLPIEKGTIATIITGVIGTAGTTVAGKTIVANLIKFIPVVGSVVGGVISGATAAALTAALGESYIAIMNMVAKGDLKMEELNSNKGRKIISTIFKERLGLNRGENGMVL